MKPVVAITLGDPAGIGPEVVVRACASAAVRRVCRPVVVGDHGIVAKAAALVAVAEPQVEHVVAEPTLPGRFDAAIGRAAGAAIDRAIALVRSGRAQALSTAPIHKQAIHAAGYPFPGHTEWLADRLGVSGETMLMWHPKLAVALVTVHQSLASVPAALSTQRIIAVGRQLAEILKRLGTPAPRLAILGLNPHAGEGGLFGSEDGDLVAPAVAELRSAGIACEGPLPPDTAFTPAARERHDGWVCLYHDQGLIPFKMLCFDRGVNVTLGLPIVRTSVDHGTAGDIAWKGVADHRSMVAAITLAARLAP